MARQGEKWRINTEYPSIAAVPTTQNEAEHVAMLLLQTSRLPAPNHFYGATGHVISGYPESSRTEPRNPEDVIDVIRLVSKGRIARMI